MKQKVRLAIAINGRGEWVASGCSLDSKPEATAIDGLEMFEPHTNEVVHFVTAEIEIPSSDYISGEVQSVGGDSN